MDEVPSHGWRKLFEDLKKESWPARASSGDQVKYIVGMFMPLNTSTANRRALQRRPARAVLNPGLLIILMVQACVNETRAGIGNFTHSIRVFLYVGDGADLLRVK
jgi:hypothetical protein